MQPTEPHHDFSNPVSRRRFMELAALGLAGAAMAQHEDLTLAAEKIRPDSLPSGHNNRAPLQPIPFQALPLGSVKAHGWLLRQLEAQRDGLTGRAEEILPAVTNSAWVGGTGENWEKGPYYLKGLISLAYTLDDSRLKERAHTWIEGILRSQREDGFFGPANNLDWWPRMVATYLLRDYAEASGDARIEPFLSRYYGYMAAHLPAQPLQEWGRARAGDEIDTIFWLYNRTGEKSLLAVADLLYKQAYQWTEIFAHDKFLHFGTDFHPKHAVNVPQALKMPPVYWQRSNNGADRNAFQAGVNNLDLNHGLGVGINSGTEFLAGKSSTQGIETCSIVERMLSDETALRILGDPAIGDNLETLAFNLLPAAITKNWHQHVYFTLPNNVTAPRGGIGYTQDYGNSRTPSPISGFPCCCYNMHMGWPKLAQNSWATTATGGLAALVYVPCEVSTALPGGAKVTCTVDTLYPFEDTVRIRLATPNAVRFPLSLRIPGWCRKPRIAVNDKEQRGVKSGSFAVLNREWKNGDEVVLTFPMEVRTSTGVNESAIIHRGPLIYTLDIEEQWTEFEKSKVEGFNALEVTPSSPWNYALALDSRNPNRSLSVRQKPAGENPFHKGETPVSLEVKARRLPQWTLAKNERISLDPPVSPVQAATAEETVRLVPFGTQMLRVTHFPVLGPPAGAPKAYRDRFAAGLADEWVTYGGGWLTRDGNFGPSPDAPSSHAVATRTHFSDFVCDAELAVGAEGNAGLTFRVSNPSIGADSYDGYYFGLSPQNGAVELGKAGGKWNPLQRVDKKLEANKVYPVRIEARGPNIRVFVEDLTQPIIEVTDNTFKSGAIGLRQYGAKPELPAARFHRVVATVA